MSWLLIGDLHLTDRARDAHRFKIFDQIKKWQDQYKPDRTFIMGDLCDQKDRHSATLVNRIADELSKLEHVRIIMGNHDYIDPKTAFFKFLNKFETVRFIDRPFLSAGVCIIPHYRTQAELDQAFREFQKHDNIKIVLLHNTFTGAISETGKELTGMTYRKEWPHPRAGIYAGDIHRPQQAGDIVYVGAPYHVRFGDDYKPRCLLIEENGEGIELYLDAPRKWKWTIREPNEILKIGDGRPGDQVKITVEMTREEAQSWQLYKEQVLALCELHGYEVYGVDLKVNTLKHKPKDVKLGTTPAALISKYCQSEGVGTKFRNTGLDLADVQHRTTDS